jgi:arsenate reductase
MAEALLNQKAGGRVIAESAGSHPAARVNPFAIEALRQVGIDWTGRTPRSTADVVDRRWDLVITVCDRAKESCPILPGQPVFAHWGMPDPAEVAGSDAEKLKAFIEARVLLSSRIDLLLSLPIEELEALVLERDLGDIPTRAPATPTRGVL